MWPSLAIFDPKGRVQVEYAGQLLIGDERVLGAHNLRKNALTLPPLTRFRWHEPVLAHVGSRQRTVLRARRPRQVQDRKVFWL